MNYQFLIPLNPEKIIQYLKITSNYVNFKLVLKSFLPLKNVKEKETDRTKQVNNMSQTL